MTLWRLADNGRFYLTTMADDESAQIRGSRLSVDPTTLEIFTKPWPGELLRSRVLLPEGVSLGTPVESEYGWTIPMSNGWEAEMVSLNETRLMAHLRNFDCPGVKVLWWLPPSAIKDDGDGYWRPKRIQYETLGSFDFLPQPRNFAELISKHPVGAIEQEAFAYGSVAIYSADKANNEYMNGKVAHIPAPEALFWKDGMLIGRVVGHLEIVGEGLIAKAFPIEQMRLLRAVADRVSIDADHGVTTVGASTSGEWPGHSQVAGQISAGTYDVTAMKWYEGGLTSTNVRMGLYEFVTSQPVTLVGTSGKQTLTSDAWNTWSVSFSFTSDGAKYYGSTCQGVSGSGGIRLKWDSGGSYIEYANNTSDYWADPLPNPRTNTLLSNGTIKASMYFTYAAASTGQPAVKRHPRSPIGQPQVRIW